MSDVADRDSNYSRIYEVVRRIPHGRVATYGQVAQLAGLGGHARQVGYAMHAIPDELSLPWQRVIWMKQPGKAMSRWNWTRPIAR